MCTHYSIKTKKGSYVSFEWDRFYDSYNLRLHDELDFETEGLIFEEEEHAFYKVNCYNDDIYHYDWVNAHYSDELKAELVVVGLEVDIKEVKVFYL